ncbi:MAG: hypothetical protein IK079_03545, partial [Desulfovibrio sp.]|nr:hypothetical protein [Desulfovibrio sp.]
QHNALRTNGGKQSRVLAEDASRLRWTEFVPLVVLNEKPSWLKASIPCPVTLVGCRIFCGARHQIRCHAAHAGYPLLFDSLYGHASDGEFFYLHHAALALPTETILDFPPWLEQGSAPLCLQNWLTL